MPKIIGRLVGLMVAVVLLFGLLIGTAQAAQQPEPSTAPSKQGNAAVRPSDETHALVVGGVAFVLILGTAGAVLWHTARSRHSEE